MKKSVKVLTLLMVVSICATLFSCSTPNCNHVWGEGVVISNPTCGQQGIMMYVCLSCGESKSTYVEKASVHINNDNDDICDICKEDFYATLVEYSLSNDAQFYIVSGIGQARTKVKILPEYNGLPVKHIENSAFKGCANLVQVEIPNTITTIGNSAFYNCVRLTTVVIPEGVTCIGESAFSGCKILSNIEIPNSITWIGANVFAGCNSLVYNEFCNTCYLGNTSNPYLCLVKATILTYCAVHKDAKLIAPGIFSSGQYSLISVVFEDTSSWVVKNRDNDTGTSIDVIDYYQNATYLKSYYSQYCWYKK